MKKNVGFLLWILLSIFITSCTKTYREADAEKEEEIVPPGETYTPEQMHNLNVVYYVPSDILEIENWHYRLSGMTLHIQNYFHENFMRYRVDKKFGLELNDANPEFIRIHYIKSNRRQAEMQEKNASEMAQEVLDYFKQNPEAKQSDHYLVWMPKYEGAFIKHFYPSDKEGFAFCGVDYTRWNPNYLKSSRAMAAFLTDLGLVLKTFAHSCFAVNGNVGSDADFMSIMGANKRGSSIAKSQPIYNYKHYAGTGGSSSSFTAGTPSKIRVPIWDVRYLSGTQLFNEKYSYEPFEVVIEDFKVKSWTGANFVVENDTARAEVNFVVPQDTLRITCKFRTEPADVELAGVTLFDDPWLTYDVTGKRDSKMDEDEMEDTGFDAYGMYMDAVSFTKEGDCHVVEFVYPMVNHLNMLLTETSVSTETHELRLRFIGKNGMAYPHAPQSIKSVEEMRYKYKVTGVRAQTKPVEVPYYQKHDIVEKDFYGGTWGEIVEGME